MLYYNIDGQLHLVSNLNANEMRLMGKLSAGGLGLSEAAAAAVAADCYRRAALVEMNGSWPHGRTINY